MSEPIRLTPHVNMLKKLMRERKLDPDERAAMIAFLTSMDWADGIIVVTVAELAAALDMTERRTRLAIGTLWALDYIAEIEEPKPGELRLTLRGEAPPHE